MKKSLCSIRAIGMAALAALLAACATPPPAEPLRVQVLALNDFHGNLLPPQPFRLYKSDGSEERIAVGGAEALATAVKQLRAGKAHHVFVAAGDLIGGSPLLSALFRDEPTLESLSAMGLHFSAVGNHEFDLGRDELLRRQRGGCHPVEGCKGPQPFTGAKFRYLAASTIDETTGQPLLPAYAIKHFDGIPVGFIGLTLKGTPQLVMPSGVAGLRFEDEAEAINRAVPELRKQGAETIVVLIHEGGYPVVRNAPDACDGLSGPILDILQRMDRAVDLVVTGHTHRAYNCVIDGRRVTSGDRFGTILTDIELRIDRRTRDVVATEARNVLVRLDQFPKDPEQTQLLAGYIERARPLRERVVGRTAAEVRAERDATGASAMGGLIADAQLEATRSAGAEIAFMNTCGIRSGLAYREGGVLRFEDLYTAQPFGNQLITVSLTGAELMGLLRRQYRSQQSCNQLQVSKGFSYTWDASRPAEDRVVQASLNGEPLQATREYRVTINNFMHLGGDGFVEFARGRQPVTGPLDVDALEALVKTQGTLQAPPLGRIKRLN